MAHQLNSGAVAQIHAGDKLDGPIVQVLEQKVLSSGGGGAKRFKLTISDGTHHMQGMLATQLNHLCDGDDTPSLQYGLIKLSNYVTNEVASKKVVILLGIDVVQAGDAVGEVIGTPVAIGGPAVAGAPEQPRAAAAAAIATPGAPAAKLAGAPTPQTAAPPAVSSMGSIATPRASGAIVRRDDNVRVTPIERLNPYQNKWTIKARITCKHEKKTWSNARGEGSLFKITLVDSAGAEIEAVFFKDACEKWYPSLMEGRVYYLSGGRLKTANRQFSSVAHDYEITFDGGSSIQEAEEDTAIAGAGGHAYSFTSISGLEQVAANEQVDILAVVKEFGDVAEVVSQKLGGKVLYKRDLTLVDASKTEVRVTIWGAKAQEDSSQWCGQPVVAFSKLKVSEWNGRSLSAVSQSRFAVQDGANGLAPLPEAGELAAWWANGGSSEATKAHSNTGGAAGGYKPCAVADRLGIADIKAKGLGNGDDGKPDYVTVRATISFINKEREPWYIADPDTKAKVTEQSDGTFYCEKTQKTIETPTKRYILSVQAADATGSSWLSAFNDQAEQLLGRTADDLAALKEAGDDAGYNDAIDGSIWKTYNMNLRVKADEWNGEKRIKTTITGLAPVDYAAESKELLAAIAAYGDAV